MADTVSMRYAASSRRTCRSETEQSGRFSGRQDALIHLVQRFTRVCSLRVNVTYSIHSR